MADFAELRDFDNFLYYGSGDLGRETRHDIALLIIQPSRSLFYSRALDSAGIDTYENAPNAIGLRILVPYNIVRMTSKRNGQVSNGDAGGVDRRVALSQNTVSIEQNGQNLDIRVEYIPLANIDERAEVSTPLGLGV